MPARRKSPYTVLGHCTGWVFLVWLLAPMAHRTQAQETAPATGAVSPLLAQGVPASVPINPSGYPVGWETVAQNMGYASTMPAPAGYPPGVLMAVPVGGMPAAIAPTGPLSPVPVGSSGTPIPWAMTQGAAVPVMPGTPGYAEMPGYAGMPVMPVMPGMPMGAGGLWMMVWVPYGAGMPPGMPPGMPIAGGSMVYGAPMMAVPGVGALPNGAFPLGMAGAVPMPYGAMPGMPMPGMPSNAYVYGAAPGGPSGFGAVMTPGIAPYAQIEPPPTTSPLAVPALPRLPSAGGAPLPLPPNSSATGGGLAMGNAAPTSGFNTVPPTALPPTAVPPFSVPPSAPFPTVTSPPSTPLPNAALPPSPTGTTAIAPPLESLNQPVTEPSLDLQGLYVLQGDQSSARVRLSGDAFLTPNLLVGGALDLATGPDLTNSDGLQLTELYLAAAVPGVPGLRFRLGQLDITSYFDRNSFAKDVGRDFFNSTFHTNPALISAANATASSVGGVVQWSLNDNLTLSAAAFSSAANITNFALDGFAGEVGLRTGDLILRGTFLTGRDTDFQGTGDRLDAYGVNAEWFWPQVNVGVFGRYGQLNSSGGLSGSTFSLGANAFDVFMDEDRLGVAYGRNLPSASVNGLTPDVLELFYDFEALPNVRMGFTFQQRNQLRESFAGFRIRSGLELLPNPSLP